MLPLSSTYLSPSSGIHTLPFSRSHFIHTINLQDHPLCAPAPLLSSLPSRFPRGFVLRGCLPALAEQLVQQHGGALISSGECALVSLENKQIRPQLLALERRASRTICCHEIDDIKISADVCSAMQPYLKYYRKPTLRFLYRNDTSQSLRTFVARSANDSNPAALIALTCYDTGAWHTETLYRNRNAAIGTMEALLLFIIRTLKLEGHTQLNLGEVPFQLSGKKNYLEEAYPCLTKRVVFFTAERLLSPTFNSQGLRLFKQKFQPTWRPTYWYFWPQINKIELARMIHSCRVPSLALHNIIHPHDR